VISFKGRTTVGFGEEQVQPPALPPLELRTAYTVKGLGIGAGGLIGYLAFGPLGMVLLGCTGWFVGNQVAINAEKDFTAGPPGG
jgi:hypothetical protein